MDLDTRRKIGSLIRKARHELGDMKQQELAERLERSVAAVSGYERAIKQSYSRAELEELEAALEIRDRRLLIAAGFEKDPPVFRDGRPAIVYAEPLLTTAQASEVLRFISWLRYRDRGEGAG